MTTEPAQINLDDIFAGIPSLQTSTDLSVQHRDSVHHRHDSIQRVDSHRSSHISFHQTSHISSQLPSTHHVSTVDIPPEPTSRASTVTHSQVSSVSTVKNEPHDVLVSHAIVQPIPAPREPAQPPTDDLMASVFGVVSLPGVDVTSPDHVHSHRPVGDHANAIQHIDDVLAGEDTDGHDGEDTISSYINNTGYSVASEQSFKASSHLSKRSQYSSQHGVSTAVGAGATKFSDLNLNGGHNGYHSSYEYYEEEHDKFEPAHLPYPAVREQGHRPRAMTADSLASVAETRYGGFDVHDEHDRETNQEIDLHHNEVAYTRPKKIATKSSVAPPNSAPIHTGGTVKLQQLNREIADANKKASQLTLQIERQQSENERLRQRNLAAEAKIQVEKRFPQQRVGSVTSSASNASGYRHSSSGVPSSHTSRSPGHSHNGHHGYSHSRTSTVTTTTATPANLVSQVSIYEEEPVRVSEVAQQQLNKGHSLGRVGKFNLVVPQMEEVQGFSKNPHIRKVVIGGQAIPTEDDKCLLLFGPVGSGKTSTVSSMLNYLYDVKKENDFRFVLESDNKHTNILTAYVINNSILPFSVTVVDTPGVVDEKNNKTVSTLIRNWFEQELLDAGAFRIDAISIVLKHDEDNLGWPFIYELAAVKKMFGDDLKTNVLPIITHTEVLPQPLAIRSLALANIAFVEYYKVNNIGFAPEAKGIPKLQHNLYFTHGLASLEQFFRGLQELIHPLLAVLRSPSGIRSAQTHFDGSALY